MFLYVYIPEEDSYFLSEIIEKELKLIINNKKKNLIFLDMGCGSCIQALKASKFINKKNIFCVDIEKEAIKKAKELNFNSIRSNLFNNKRLKNRKYDIIAFNPPYLPCNKYDNEKDICGGERGDEIILKFLDQAKKYLRRSGIIFLLFSSLTPKKRIINKIKKYYEIEKIYKKNLFMETLFIYKLLLK
ncbi:MAG: methyltransferase [Candidatus Pacearchaeota archaeon]